MATEDNLRILILDDEVQFTEELNEFFENLGFNSFQANTVEAAKKILSNHEIDILLLDIRLPGVNGLNILVDLKLQNPEMEVIIVSAHADMDSVSKAISFGAFDYLRKPFRFLDIQVVIKRIERHLHLKRQMKKMEERNSLITRHIERKSQRLFVGSSAQIKKVIEEVAAASTIPFTNVLITGEPGAGKKYIARIIQAGSSRKDNFFFIIDHTIKEDLPGQIELFGQKKGSNDTKTDSMGLFELCYGGTLFLDEIADLPMSLQEKIELALETKEITRVGDTKKIPIEFNIISTTIYDLKNRVKQKKFRADLLHRLSTVKIHVPALRERKEDIRPLLQHFVELFSKELNKPDLQISEDVFEAIGNYDFPGNIRELRNMAERAVILCKGKLIGITDFLF